MQVKGEIEAAAESLVNLRSCDAALLSTKKAYQHACDYQSRQFGKMAKANTDPAAGAKAKQGVREGGGKGWPGLTYFILPSIAAGG